MTEHSAEYELVIRPRYGILDLNWKEIIEYRELLFFLALREIKIRYKQTLMGASWAILQPFFTMIIFSLIFGGVAKIPSEGIPYPVFSYSGLLLWTYFHTSLSSSSGSMVANSQILSKVYLPRIFLPTAPCIAHLVDYVVALSILILMMLYFQLLPTASVILLPIILFLTLLLAAGMGYWLSSINVKYRDVQYALPFFINLLLFVSPVIYPTDILGEELRWILFLNPLTGLINAHRAVLLGYTPVDYAGLGIAAIITIVIFLTGVLYLRKTEKYFADLI